MRITVIKEENNTITQPIMANQESNKNEPNNNLELINPIGTIVTLGILGGGAYLGYKKYKRKK